MESDLQQGNSKINPYITAIITGCVILVGIYLYSSYRKNQTAVKQSQLEQYAEKRYADPEANRRFVESRTTVVIPEVKSSKEISINNLPDDIRKLVNPTALELKAKEVSYVSGSGYNIYYKVNSSLSESFLYFSRLITRDWDIIQLVTSGHSSLTELKDKNFQVKITQIDLGNNVLEITIDVINLTNIMAN